MQHFSFTGTVRLKENQQDVGAMDFGFVDGAREIFTDVYHMNATAGQGKTIDLNTTEIGRANFFAIRCEKPITLMVNVTAGAPTTYNFDVRDFVIMQCDQITKIRFHNTGTTAYRYPNKVRIWIGAQGISGD